MYRTLLEGVWLSGQWMIYTFHISRSHTLRATCGTFISAVSKLFRSWYFQQLQYFGATSSNTS